MTHPLTPTLSRLFLLGILLSFAIGLNYLHAWTAPTLAPTGGNVPAPLNTGGSVQSKSGGLQMSSLDITGTNGASLVGGQLSFWNASTIVNPQYTIDMGDLDPGANNGIRFPDDTVQTTAGGGSLGLSFSKYMQVQHRTAADYAISAGWMTRAINFDVENSIPGASRTGNQITLPAGTYYVDADANAFSTGQSKNAFYNVTDGAYTLAGIVSKPNGGGQDQGGDSSQVTGKFTISGTKTFEFRMNSNEGGFCQFMGDVQTPNICLDLKIWKLD